MRKLGFFVLLVYSVSKIEAATKPILYPRESETRERISLDGIWYFLVGKESNPLQGFNEKWYQKDLRQVEDYQIHYMPVPASYNDITTNGTIRDHVGLVWYQRSFFVPSTWKGKKVWLRFGSVCYAAQVWVNDNMTMAHEIGHLPFESEVTNLVNYGKVNIVTLVVDNTLLVDTLPQGKTYKLSSGRLFQEYTFDFFNYAGIDRSVFLYSTPNDHIKDITINSNLVDNTGIVTYKIDFFAADKISCKVSLLDKWGAKVTESFLKNANEKSELRVKDPKLWWPYLMAKDPGYLYTFQVELLDLKGKLVDVYRQKIGIRTLSWNDTTFLINNKPIYLRGFGRHEDSDIRGKGLDYPLITRDHNLIKWIGANAYRTSHYPYAEEIMDFADEYGIMIIDECPAVNVEGYSDALLQKHKESLSELIQRDKNRPSVVMWSAANEPRTQQPAAGKYFKNVIEHIKSLDTSRPVTIVEAQAVGVESSTYVDIISFNRYNGWYSNPGNLDMITEQVITEATDWHNEYKKPVIMQEYGADTMEGLHFQPSFIWSEDYQVQVMSRHFEAFDDLRDKGWFLGEFIWNFADFKTPQQTTRVGGNKKGIFTRNREPKQSAHHLRKRYWKLAKILNNVSLPVDLIEYTAAIKNENSHFEL